LAFRRPQRRRVFLHGAETRDSGQVLYGTKAFVFTNDNGEVEFEVMTDAKVKWTLPDRVAELCESLFYRDSACSGDAVRDAVFVGGTRMDAETVRFDDMAFNAKFSSVFIANQPAERHDSRVGSYTIRFGVEE